MICDRSVVAACELPNTLFAKKLNQKKIGKKLGQKVLWNQLATRVRIPAVALAVYL
jgi:hypothetical protein